MVTTFGNNPPGHQLAPILSASKVGHTLALFPTTFADGAAFSAAGGIATYESMLVKITPAAPFMIGTVDSFGSFMGAGQQFSGLFRFQYSSGGSFPAANSTWSAITGVVSIGFVDGIAPRAMSDFQP